MSESQRFSVDVTWKGKRHTIVVGGQYSPAIGFGPPGSKAASSKLASGRLEFTCNLCGGDATFPFTAPSSDWRRPFIVLEVTHHDEA